MDLQMIYYLDEQVIEELIRVSSEEDILIVYGIEKNSLLESLKVERFVYLLNLEEQLIKRNKLFSLAEINRAETKITTLIKEIFKLKNIQTFEDIIYLDDEELHQLVTISTDDELFKCLIVSPDTVMNHVKFALNETLLRRLARHPDPSALVQVEEIEIAQEELVKRMKEIRSR